jgi:hypothetical protein
VTEVLEFVALAPALRFTIVAKVCSKVSSKPESALPLQRCEVVCDGGARVRGAGAGSGLLSAVYTFSF